MNKEEALIFLNRLAEGIAKTFGSSCETVIHDIKNKNNSIVAIYNGHVTGRKVGDKLDMLGLSGTEFSDFFSGIDHINCRGISKTGNIIKSSTFYLIGEDYHYALGINFDFTALSLAESVIKDFIKVDEDIKTSMNQSGEERLENLFKECVDIIGKPISMMNKDDRIKIIAMLQERNAFSFQKSIPYVSEKLNISRYTIYNYLKELKGK